MNIFRKLRGRASRRSRRSESAPSAPAATAESESETVNPSPPPRAVHISEVKRSPTLLSSTRKPVSETQSLTIMVANAKGAADSLRLYRLLQRETDYGSEYDPTDDFETNYVCDGCMYNVHFDPVPDAAGPWAASLAMLTMMLHHVCLVFTYDAKSSSSRESWDEMVAVCENLRSRSEDGVLAPFPFLATVIVAMGEGGDGEGVVSVSHAEAEAFAAERNCLFARVSPTTGRGICDAVGSLVERAHSARGQYSMAQAGEPKRYKRAQTLKALFSPSLD